MRPRTAWVVAVALFALLTPVAAALAQPGAPADEQEWSPPEVVTGLLEDRLDTQVIVPGEIVVKLKAGADPTAAFGPMGVADDLERTSGGELVVRLAGAAFAAMADEEQAERTLEVVQQLQERDDVDYAQANYMLQIVRDPGDTLYRRQWHYFENGSGSGRAGGGIGLPAVWDVTTGSDQVVVAVIDTGILPDHEDIAGSPNLLTGFDMIRSPTVAADGDGRDADPTDPGDAVRRGECGTDMFGNPVPSRDEPDSWHGSHVAGTVGVGRTDNGLGVAGANWNVRVLPVRVLGKCGGSIVDINDAIRWSAGLPVPGVPDNPNPADVINLSLGGRGSCGNSPATQRAIDDAVAAGATVVVAAGNEAEDASGFMPASCDRVITVAAADRRGHLVLRYSNFGERVDIMAPGGDVGRDDDNDGRPDGVLSYVEGGYDFYNGTSMAAPHVAGVAALLKGQRPELTPAQIESELVSHARSRTDAQCPRRCGAGLLDAGFVVGGRDDEEEEDEEEEVDKVPAAPLALLAVALLLLPLLLAARRREERAGR